MSKITDTVEKLAVKEAVMMLEKIPETSEAVASEDAPGSATKENQTSTLPSSTPTLSSPSNDSDLDNIPIGQRITKLKNPLQNLNKQPNKQPFRKNRLQQLLKVLMILKNQNFLTFLPVIHPQICIL